MENVIYLSSWLNWLFIASVAILVFMLAWNNSPKFQDICINCLSKLADSRTYIILGFILSLILAGILISMTIPIIKSPLLFISLTCVAIFVVLGSWLESYNHCEDGNIWILGAKYLLFTVLVCAFVGYVIQVGNDAFIWKDFSVRLLLLVSCWVSLFLPGILSHNEERW